MAEIVCKQHSESQSPGAKRLVLIVAALGVVFGDIGTSPLYALRECFVGSHALSLTPVNILGAASLIMWFLVLIVCLKYVLFIMRADNRGEGGILALMALVERIGIEVKGGQLLGFISFLGIVGCALLFSDGIITPAISVLSAVEGLTVVAPRLAHLIVPISLAILVVLFSIQSHGTARIGTFFGPIVLLWFAVIGTLGMIAICRQPMILKALNPWYALIMLTHNGWQGFSIIGIAFLAVTGTEVLYADMGHFGRKPIRSGWFVIVFPALLLNYLGQAAFLLGHPGIPQNLFFLIAPRWFVLPLVILATITTVIASQAVITGMFSLARQAVQLGFWPRLRVVHTSAVTIGQVYVPFINFALCVGTLFLTFWFKESGRLANAYGIAVSTTMLITTVLAFFIARQQWRVPFAVLIVIGTVFIILDLSLFAANLLKLFSGGIIVVFIAIAIVLMMRTWVKGRAALRRKAEEFAISLGFFINDLEVHKPKRVTGTAIFLSGSAGGVPRALLHNFKHNKMVHDRTVCLTIVIEEIPMVPMAERAAMTTLGEGLYQVVMRFGFMETLNIPRALVTVLDRLEGFDPMSVTYFLGKETLVFTRSKNMPVWRKRIYSFLSKNASDASAYFNLPPNRVVELGLRVEL
jgi:KUP system potassium uptake protein